MKDKGNPVQNIHAAQSPQLNKTILIVEDDRAHRVLIDKILQSCGFDTVLAEDGIIALSKIDAGESFDLILMDWDMKGLNGLDAVRNIREREIRSGAPRIPVIAFTANRNPGDREACLAAGMDAYLPKDVWTPRWRSMLVDNLQGLIGGRFEAGDIAPPPAPASMPVFDSCYEINAFDEQILEQTISLLKNDFDITVDEYLEDASAYIRDIREGLDLGDSEKAARGSHPLKSNSRGFGLISVSQLAEAINTRARARDLESAQALFPRLEEAFRVAEKRLRAAIKEALSDR